MKTSVSWCRLAAMALSCRGSGALAPLDAFGTPRPSALLPGMLCIHADLHNHTRLSDGAGDPARVYGALRGAGLDVAAVTDHVAPLAGRPGGLGVASPSGSIDPHAWRQLGVLAAAAQEDSAFVALRGFEWSHPLLGHVNVWDSPQFTYPHRTLPHDMRQFFDWIDSAAAGDGLACFNHPGSRGTVLRFDGFSYRESLRPRMVGFEIFNKTDDYLLAGLAEGLASPLVESLRAGWRPGLLGVTDEHGDDWGRPEGKGRTGLFVSALTRSGVREALLARRGFAARVGGLRLAATLGGVPMGGVVPARNGPMSLAVDVDLGPKESGRELAVQLLASGHPTPTVAVVDRIRSGTLLRMTCDARDAPWLVLRISDPDSPPPEPAGELSGYGKSVAYASPWWIDPDVAPIGGG